MPKRNPKLSRDKMRKVTTRICATQHNAHNQARNIVLDSGFGVMKSIYVTRLRFDSGDKFLVSDSRPEMLGRIMVEYRKGMLAPIMWRGWLGGEPVGEGFTDYTKHDMVQP